jgi:hypothetical protein
MNEWKFGENTKRERKKRMTRKQAENPTTDNGEQRMHHAKRTSQ